MIDTKELRQLAQDATPGSWLLRTTPTSAVLCHIVSATDWRGAFIYGDGIRKGVDDALPKAQELAANARLIATANPAAISELLDRLEAAEKERDWNAERLEDAIEELKALRAKIEAAEKQKPVMWANSSNIISTRIWPARGSVGYQHACSETKTAYHDTPLYLAPGAKGEDK